jgi:hypothetical protein
MEKVEVIMSESNDWIIVRRGKKVLHEAHNISHTDFCCILRELGIPVKEILIPDKAMAEGTY